MAGVRGMLQRVAKLEAARTSKPSPIEAIYGSVDAFAAECMAGVEAGKLCPVDMPVVIECLRRWHRDGDYGVRHTVGNGVWNRA
ncbi:hypothetical protein LV780_13895 [Cereibacter azotoformans]|uniref:Uncharacterized protein n=1 Tax=Cereibacter azotoformans TaxID=43057 RepID=A0A2T5JIU6_9RHOB|nr:hypothetical protein [Cereibacter azotoformans]AXQ94805.1 hypothetical protein D0Z66_13915 [Cereibacter sphaeroides]MBO4170332.1 hypothetical protein [Cereibacter azotoformans]PTR05993.1 hypothetical protein C8J28_1546 [Cereibacter azotoformans]UIJ30376.1 hypothetical protein LV780_13895 [Cereibacter azotoformans]